LLPCLVFSTTPSPTHLYTLSLHDALPISLVRRWLTARLGDNHPMLHEALLCTSELVSNAVLHAATDGVVWLRRAGGRLRVEVFEDRKSTRLNSSHVSISYAVFCLKKKKDK